MAWATCKKCQKKFYRNEVPAFYESKVHIAFQNEVHPEIGLCKACFVGITPIHDDVVCKEDRRTR